jgi:hypothetical protein
MTMRPAGFHLANGRFLLCACLLLLSPSLGSVAWSHDFYDKFCCHNRDCRPVPATSISEAPEGYLVRETGELIPYQDRRIHPSPDNDFHRCSIHGDADSHTLCIYAPPRSF